jgi:titin
VDKVIPLTQSLSRATVTVPNTAPAGHYFVIAHCDQLLNSNLSNYSYATQPFLVTGGTPLPTLTISKTSGRVGTVIDVFGPCGMAGLTYSAAIFSGTNHNLWTAGLVISAGLVPHVSLTVPSNFQPGVYYISAICEASFYFRQFAERTFTVLAGPPAAPTGIGARPGSTTSTTVGPIIVTYSTPPNHGYAITKYTAACTSTNGGATRTSVHIGATATPIVVANATLKRTYTCRVVATNAKGNGPWSVASGPIVVGAPARVGTPSAARIAEGELRVSFPMLTAAATNGSPLTTPKYTATCKSGQGVTKSASAASTPILVTGLTVGSYYVCTVSAHNARGSSAPSPPSYAVRA